MTIVTKTIGVLAVGAITALTSIAVMPLPALAGGVKFVPITPVFGVIQVPKQDKPEVEIPVIQYPVPKPIYFPLPIDFPVVQNDDRHAPQLAVDCKIADASGMTDDMWLLNFGSDDIPGGTKVRYSVPSTGDHGAFALPRTIEAGKKFRVSDLLHGAVSGAPCRVQIIE